VKKNVSRIVIEKHSALRREIGFAGPGARMTYRIYLPTLALAFRDNHQAAVTIPAGKIVHVIGPAEDNRFVVVSMNGEQFHIFAADLADRGRQTKAAAR
jgi:hypothetical protein